MEDRNKTLAQLVDELAALRERLAGLETQYQQAQNEIKRVREFTHSIAQTMIEGVAAEDAEGRFIFVNRAAAAMLGYAVEELLGRRWALIIPPDQWPIVQAANARRVNGLSDRYELELVGKQDNRITVLVAGSPRFDADTGQFLGTLAVFTDITERKQAETSLRESERFSRATIENLPIGLSVRSRTGRLLYYNQAWKKIWAMPDEAIRADLTRERTELTFDTRDGYLNQYQDELRQVYENGSSLHLPELCPTRPRPGGAKWIGQHFFALKDDHDQVDRVVILTEDITARKEMERALHQSEEQFRTLFENSPDGILLLDPDSRVILDCNQAACQMNGYRREELVGQLIDILNVGPGDGPDPATYRESLGQSTPKYETLHRRKDGSIFPIEVSTCLIQLPGRDVILGIDRDITERKQVEQTLAQHAHELTALYETSLQINAQPDLAALLRAIVERATELLGARMGGLYLIEPDGETLKLVVAHNLPGHYEGTLLRPGEGLSGRIAQTGQLLMIEDYSRWEGQAAPYARSGLRRVLGVPLKVGDEVIGVINVNDDERTGPFTQDEVRLASLFADQAALAIEKARLLEETQRRAERMKALNEAGQALASTLGLPRLYQVIYGQACRVLQVDAFYIALYDEQQGTMHLPFLYDGGKQWEAFTVPLDQGPTAHVIRTQAPLMVNQPGHAVLQDARHYGNLERSSASSLHVPMLARDRVVGVISAQSYQTNAYSPEDQQVLEVIASQAAIAIENARLYKAQREQREMAETLSETGALLAASLDMGAVLDRILQQVSRIVPNDAADIMLVEGERVRIARWRGYDRFGAEDYIATFNVPLVDLYGLPKMIATGEPFFIPDTYADPRWSRFPAIKWIRSYVSAPLRVRGRVLGFVNANSATPKEYGQAEADRLSAFANQAALALANARLYQAEQEQRELAETLRAFGATLASTLDADAVLERLLDQIGGIVPNDLSLVMLVEAGVARTVKGRGFAEHGIKDPAQIHRLDVYETANLRQMSETQQPIVVPDIRAFPGWIDEPQTLWIHAHVGAPIRIKKHVVGFLNLYSATPHFFTQAHATRLQALADQVAVALENARLYQAEREQFRRWQESQAQLIQAEKMAALGRLVGSISHEFNNPLQAVIGALELCREEVDGRARQEQLRRYLSVMEKETERIAAIVRRVRDFYRPVTQEKQRTDLDTVVDKVLELTSEQLQRYGIAVEREKASTQASELALYVNPDDLKQVLLNLALNAIDAMAQHGGTLRVSTALDKAQSPEGGPRPAARIQISDTGAGISPDMLPHIFEPFVTTRADQSTPPASKTALGLSISYGIVQAYGGEITASSQVGVGTTFTVLLPL